MVPTSEQTAEALLYGKISRRQFETFEIYITHNWRATILAKKALQWFLRKSNYFERSIVMSIPSSNEETDLSIEVASAVHDMSSSACRPLTLYDIYNFMGCDKYLSFQHGIAQKVTHKLISFNSSGDGHTIWLADHENRYSLEVEFIELDREAIIHTLLRQNYFESNDSSHPEFYEDNRLPTELYQASYSLIRNGRKN